MTHVIRTQATGYNVTTELRGTESPLAPLGIMTPRSGWYACGGERGAGIACWLEILQGLARSPLRCPVLFVSSSGHELGHLGIDAFIARRSGIVKRARAWLNLGANIGAVTVSTDVRLQASDDELDTVITDALMVEGIVVAQRASQNAIPSGEVESVRRAGGRCATVMCGNLLFHNVKDCGLKVTSPEAVERFSRAFITVTRSLARTS